MELNFRRVIVGGIGLFIAAFCGGCAFLGLLANPSGSERMVPAQLRLTARQDGGIAVWVTQSAASNAPPELRRQLTGTIYGHLFKRAKVNKRYLVAADDSSPERAKIEEQLMREPIAPDAIGRMLNTGTLIYVRIERCELDRMDEREYYSGALLAHAVVIDTAAGRILWPESGAANASDVRVELETSGRDATLNRLTEATAHCIVRNFYDCPRRSFRVSEEQVSFDEEDL